MGGIVSEEAHDILYLFCLLVGLAHQGCGAKLEQYN